MGVANPLGHYVAVVSWGGGAGGLLSTATYRDGMERKKVYEIKA